MQRANATGIDAENEGERDERILGQGLTPAGYVAPPAFTLGTAPRTDGRLRTAPQQR